MSDWKDNSVLYQEKLEEELKKAYSSLNLIYNHFYIANLDSDDDFLYDLNEAKKHIQYHNGVRKQLFKE